MRYAPHDPTLADWVDFLEPALENIPALEDKKTFLHAQIDKARQRGVMSESMVFALHQYFRLVD